MSELRLWIHGKIARLDGARERRFVALAAGIVFAALTVGPQAWRAVDAAINSPGISVDALGSAPLAVPFRFRATTQNFVAQNVAFKVRTPDGTDLAPIPAHLVSSTSPFQWESDLFANVPGTGYVVRAIAATNTASGFTESAPVTFSILDPNGGSSGSGGTSGGTTGSTSGGTTGGTSSNTSETGSGSAASAPKIVELLSLVAWPGVEPRIEVRGRHSGFTATSAAFHIRAMTGLAYEADRPAEAEGENWHGLFAVPGGALYQVKLIVPDTGGPRISAGLEVLVPAAETPAASGQSANTPPPPAVSLLLPTASSESLSPVPLAARVTNATATAVTFEVVDPAGVTRPVTGTGSGGEWTAMFVGEPGQYAVGVRVFLTGSVIPPANFRPFRILAAATSTPAAEQPASTATNTASAPEPEPFVEIFSPAAAAEPFPAAVPISARVRNGLPDKVVALVSGPSGDTVAIARKSASGDYWTALFEGPDGEYRFRVRATVAGKDYLSTERRFAVKHPLTVTPPPTTAVSPTSAPATTGATAPPPPLPPPPPPPTGTTLPATTGAATSPATGGTLTPPETYDASIPATLATECRTAGIPPLRCAEWLKAKYQSRECLDAGALTREACAETLRKLNIAPSETQLFGLASKQDISQAREDAKKLQGEPVRRDELPASIAALIPPAKDPTAFVRVVAVANAKEDSSPALLVIDTDGDGLPDDVERRLGTDPAAADTDGDGFSDGMEVRNGYDPLGPGALAFTVRGVEKALIGGLAIEEPRGADALVDPGFTIATAPTPAEAAEEDVIRLSGTAAPNSVVTIFVYSYLPVVVTTTTDENGNWTYDFGSKLAEGRHEAYVSVNDDTGKLVASSSPLSFFVKEAQAVSEEDFLRPDLNVEETPATFSRWFIYGGVALVALALFLVIAIVRQTRKSPTDASGESL